ncbi:MAG: DUF4091 domain-containing protein, partial [Candidatus Hydrogenedentes bacterium]|nr:DUF4091 domain-containing protein [Candidatus Hydrogenedentota bacterium]
VKGEGVEGRAGWFIHVHGDRPLLINRAEAADGTFDWREVAIEFEVPESGTSVSCGTLLHGTGRAWFDDARLDVLGGDRALSVRVTGGQRRELDVMEGDADWPHARGFTVRAPIRARNFTDKACRNGMVLVDTGRVQNRFGKLFGFTASPTLMVVDPSAPGQSVPLSGTLDRGLCFAANIPAGTEKVMWLYAGAGAPEGRASEEEHPGAWAARPGNLVANGTMEAWKGDRPAVWELSGPAQGRDAGFEARRVRDGVYGEWCLELTVPEEVEKPGWTGWRQRVPVKPGTSYLLAGYVKSMNADCQIQIHGHFRRADGTHTAHPFFQTAEGITGDHDWTRTAQLVTTPGDCAFIEIHLTINGHGTIRHDAVLLSEACRGIVGDIERRRTGPAGLRAWPVNPLVKVFRDDLPPEKPQRDVEVYASRNTWESFQIAVRAPEGEGVTVEASPLSGPDGATLDAPAVFRVGYVPIDFPVGYAQSVAPDYHRMCPTRRGNDGWRDWWPDPLVPGDGAGTTFRGGPTQPVWFDVRVPASAVPGKYKGRVTVRTATAELTVPVRLTVWNFTQSDENRLAAIYDLRNGPGGNVFSGPDRVETIRHWYRFLAQYHVSPGFVIDGPAFAYADGTVTMDTTQFDELASVLFDELHVSKVYTPNLFYACGWAYAPRDVFGLKAFTPEYVAAWKSAYGMFVDHITQKGWRDRFVLYLSDEPHEHSEVTITGLARVADMARSVAPDVLVYSSTWRYMEGLADHLTLWGIGPQGTWTEEQLEARRAAGDRFWFTTDGQMCTDTPFVAIERLLPWFCFKYGVEAYEFWGVSWWTYNPWECGWHWYIRQSNEGTSWYYVRYPNGDGYLAYPSPDGRMDRPAPSIRLVAARDGVEDFELFRALAKHAEAGNGEARQALDRVRELVRMPNRGGRYSTDIMADPDAVQEARIAVGELVSGLSGQAD